MSAHGLTQKDAARHRRCDNCQHRSRTLGPVKCLHEEAEKTDNCPGRQLPGEEDES